MVLYHTSVEDKITPLKFGSDIFGDALFFSSNVYVMTASNVYFVHEIDSEELNIANDYDFETELDGWEGQADIAKQSFDAGFDGVKSFDEQGAVWMLNAKVVCSKMKLSK